jgi:hypothetical protein
VGDDAFFDLFQTANKSRTEGPVFLRDLSWVKRDLIKEIGRSPWRFVSGMWAILIRNRA